MSSEPKYIVGELVRVGTPDGSEQPQVLIYCSEAEIRGVKQLPMMRRVAIVPLDMLHGSAVPPIMAECQRLRAAMEVMLPRYIELFEAAGLGPAEESIAVEMAREALSAAQETPLPSDESNP